MSGLAGRSVLITGAGAGIGRETALAFARAGARLVLGDIASEAAEASAEMARAMGTEAVAVRADVSRDSDVQALVAMARERFGGLDVAFNNAGIEEENALIADCEESLFDRIMAINVKGVWLCMKHQLAVMRAQGSGSIINTASVAGLVGAPRHAAYAASKHAVIGLTKSVAAEYGRHRVRVNAVCPGVIRTAMLDRWVGRQTHTEDPNSSARKLAATYPLGRFGEASEIANAVLWLASDTSSYVTGHALTVDGGFTVI